MKKFILFQILCFALCWNCASQKATSTDSEAPEINPMENSTNSSLVQPKDPLLGKWKLEYMNPNLGRDIKHYKIQKPFLNFVDDHKVAGNNGCNNIAGEYQADFYKIQFQTEKFASTRMFCEGVDEAVYLKALSSITSYAVMDDGQKLVLSAGDEIQLVFLKQVEGVEK